MREQEPRLHGDDFDQRFAEIIAALENDPDFARRTGHGEVDDDPESGGRGEWGSEPSSDTEADASPGSHAELGTNPGNHAGSGTGAVPGNGTARGNGTAPGNAADTDQFAEEAPRELPAEGEAPGRAKRADLPGRRDTGALLGESIPVWRGASGPAFDEVLDAEDDEHFIPAPPAPLPPQDDLHFWAMLLCLVGGPLILVWLVFFSPDVGEWWTWLALSMCVGGFVLLVLRGPRERGPGNGAVV